MALDPAHAPSQSDPADPTPRDPLDPMLSPHRLRPPEALRLIADGLLRPVDVRKAPARAASAETLIGAPWVDPAAFDPARLAAEDPRPVVLFCVHGHEVSQRACEKLRHFGRAAYFVAGGFEALRTAGASIAPLGPDEGESET